MARDDRAVQLRKGVLELAILALLEKQERYGGEIVDELGGRPGLEASAGTVYPLLTRLRTSGLVDTAWRESPVGPPRKYYTLTGVGREVLADMAATWRSVDAAITTILKDPS